MFRSKKKTFLKISLWFWPHPSDPWNSPPPLQLMLLNQTRFSCSREARSWKCAKIYHQCTTTYSNRIPEWLWWPKYWSSKKFFIPVVADTPPPPIGLDGALITVSHIQINIVSDDAKYNTLKSKFNCKTQLKSRVQL